MGNGKFSALVGQLVFDIFVGIAAGVYTFFCAVFYLICRAAEFTVTSAYECVGDTCDQHKMNAEQAERVACVAMAVVVFVEHINFSFLENKNEIVLCFIFSVFPFYYSF